MEMGDIRGLGQESHVFQNWAGTYSCRPELYFEPETVEEIRQILSAADRQTKTVKVCGRGHSPSDIVCTTDFMINLKNFNQVTKINKDTMEVKMEGGTMLNEVNEILDKEGLALPVLGSISEVTIAGAIATGTHGKGHNYGTLASYVTELELISANGELHVLSRESKPEYFLAACTNLGALGIVTSVTIQCTKAYKISTQVYGTSVENIIKYYEMHSKCSDHTNFLWYPPDNCVVDHGFITKEPVRHNNSWLWDILVGVYLLELLLWISSFVPAMVKWINWMYFKYIGSRVEENVDRSDRQLNMNCRFSQYVMEWAIPSDMTGRVMFEIKTWIENHNYPAHFPIEIRPTKGDDLYLSPAYGRQTTYMNIISYRPYGKTIDHAAYWQAFQDIMLDAGGRPHWAKDFSLPVESLQKMYPKWSEFCRVREELDPNGVFLNDNLKRFFGRKYNGTTN